MPTMPHAFVTKIKLTLIAGVFLCALPGAGQVQLMKNDKLLLGVNAKQGTYQVAMAHNEGIFNSRVAAEVDHRWLRPSDYPHCDCSPSEFSDALGSGHQVTVTCSGLSRQPDLVYIVQIYDQNPYGALQVRVRNTAGKQITVQAIRSIEAIGPKILELGGPPAADRVLSDSFSEDWPEMKIYDLGNAPDNLHRASGSR